MLEFTKKSSLEEEIRKAKRITTLCSAIRLAMAVATIVFLACLASLQEYVRYSILSGLFFAFFLLSVILSNPFYRNAQILENKKKAYLRHEQRRIKETGHFADTGADFKDKDNYMLQDLDIFGPKSIYQYLSEAKTPLGRKKLALQLTSPEKKPKEFTACTAKLAECEDSLSLEAALMEFKKGTLGMTTDEFLDTVSHKIPFRPLHLLPLVTFLAAIVYAVLIFTPGITPYPLIGILVLNFLSSKFCLANEPFTKDSQTYYRLADLYYDLAQSIKKMNLDDAYFSSLKERITGVIPDLKRVKGIYSMLSLRRNLILNITGNLLFSMDFFLMLIFNLRVRDTKNLYDALDAIAELEVMLSFKNVGMDNPVYCIPSEGDKTEASEMVHLLVKNCVPNSFILNGGVILTGSNMSGKTTFMRTLGTAQILFNAGSLVPALSYSSEYLPVYTSLRANDMLSEGVSTFYAEILRMKRLNQGIRERKSLVLVDEIFKGTNANERIEASLQVIDRLNEFHSLFIISTHDFEICDAKNVENFHFEENYEGDKISFDYHIHEGRSTTRNAMVLLKMAGIVE